MLTRICSALFHRLFPVRNHNCKFKKHVVFNARMLTIFAVRFYVYAAIERGNAINGSIIINFNLKETTKWQNLNTKLSNM